MEKRTKSAWCWVDFRKKIDAPGRFTQYIGRRALVSASGGGPVTDLLQHLRRVVLRCDGAGLSDGQLLECFLTQHDEEAFAALVRRHGPMVWGVCHRILRSLHDTEDAFQATFLVLARKGASVRPREFVGNWLYGVAYRTALRARSVNARRREKEKETVDRSAANTAEEESWLELLPHLDRELDRLPEKYRLPVVLCDLEGRSRKEVAGQLKIPEGTLSSRLATARKLLAGRLRRHGLTLAGGALAALLAENGASAYVPKALMVSTVKAAGLIVAGKVTAGVVSATVATLTEGVMKAMLLSKLRIAVVLLLAVAVLTTGASLPAYRIWAAAPSESNENAPPEDNASEKAPSKEKGAQAAPKADKHEVIRGSGKLITKEMKVGEFTSVDVSNAFSVNIIQGQSFQITVNADDNLFSYIKVVNEDAGLRVFLDAKNKSFQNATLEAAITMPSLSGLNLGGACRAAIKGFKGIKSFRAKVGGASHLKGDIEAAELRLDANGASRIELNGLAKSATLSATGASWLRLADLRIEAGELRLEAIGASGIELKGSTKGATLSATGASKLHLTDLRIDHASVRLSGASQAAIQVENKLDYTLDGASSLQYRGKPTIGKKSVSGASSVRSK
jgi:RNA polymerase sigma factor (sigma-70 family)